MKYYFSMQEKLALCIFLFAKCCQCNIAQIKKKNLVEYILRRFKSEMRNHCALTDYYKCIYIFKCAKNLALIVSFDLSS